jgi:hypothetical protein
MSLPTHTHAHHWWPPPPPRTTPTPSTRGADTTYRQPYRLYRHKLLLYYALQATNYYPTHYAPCGRCARCLVLLSARWALLAGGATRSACGSLGALCLSLSPALKIKEQRGKERASTRTTHSASSRLPATRISRQPTEAPHRSKSKSTCKSHRVHTYEAPSSAHRCIHTDASRRLKGSWSWLAITTSAKRQATGRGRRKGEAGVGSERQEERHGDYGRLDPTSIGSRT